jgi:hypothetical protein
MLLATHRTSEKRAGKVLQWLKKKHIIKMQLIVNEQDMKIQHAYLETEGRKSDFRIFKESN